MQPREIIAATREGKPLRPAELENWLKGYLKREIPDYLMSAWLMAVFFRGLSPDETATLTRCLWQSGITFPREPGKDYWIDKHSTGGVGDKTSLLLVPIVAVLSEKLLGAGQVRIPMISGRALGHSGGTLDKLESVPGFSPAIAIPAAAKLLRENGFFMMGQTDDLAPLDRLLYALRDVTATVESRPLIVSSIMSKKLAENLDGLVVDVKVGTGAFMKTQAEAKALAMALIEVAKHEGKEAVAVLTSMEEPLGRAIGNCLEVEECWHYLTGEEREAGLHEVTKELAAWMIHLASRRKVSLENARTEYDAVLESDRESLKNKFRLMLESQGGKLDAFLSRGKSGILVQEWRAESSGYLEKMGAYELGVLNNRLGGGRLKKEDLIDTEVGIRVEAKVGERVEKGQGLARVFYREPAQLELIESFRSRTVNVVAQSVPRTQWIREVV